MSYPSNSRRFLKSSDQSSTSAPAATEAVDSDFVVILAALLCALICVLGLVAVARCAWIRRLSGSSTDPHPHPPNPKGLKKKVLRTLPKLTFSAEISSPKLADCPICLSEFTPGDEIRVLPHCGHAFHLSCVDTWLESHSSCPSCRQILVVARCKKCGGGLPPAAEAVEGTTTITEDSGGGNSCGMDTDAAVSGPSSNRGRENLAAVDNFLP